MRTLRTAAIAAITMSTLALAACSSDDPDTESSDSPTAAVTGSSEPTAAAGGLGTEVTVVTHDSFAVPDDVISSFEEESGLKVTFVAPGDGGTLVNQLILTKDAPLGDVVFGVDNTFASRAIDEDVFADYTSSAPAAAQAAQYAVPDSAALTAIDFSDVCLNIDTTWFDAEGVTPPATLEDLLSPDYKGLLSVTNPATSSPGLAFLLATIAAEGDGWQDYWKALDENDLRVTSSWSDTYFTDFSAPNYGGDYPIVLSYASSPPSEVTEDGTPTTAALLDTCFRQVEYAGVLNGAKNPAAAEAVVDWMLSDAFQASIPGEMYVYPVSTSVDIPAAWEEFAPLATTPWTLTPAEITANRDDWIRQWTDIVTP
ncbi:thiamine ABC transporter substrate-binding protein [Demequina aurantiaca]|uniref:thiamine ABC transporter substrate-binding protein n=1 Tax=Demequina aurantiaca TaxID=676200 RepID=UPI000785D894|nr:thiamine ABC transporter substrate-binding protein [Demequina aurantiaca]